MLPSIPDRIAAELSVRPEQVGAAIALLDEGATVPFVARYRKEVTGSLDDTHLRALQERLTYMRELEERRNAVLELIDSQGKLNDGLKSAIFDAETKQRLEDLYLPYKVKRRTKAEIAREAGLDELADLLLADHTREPVAEAGAFVREPFSSAQGDNPGVADAKSALEGARYILMDRFSEDAQLLAELRGLIWERAHLTSAVVADKEDVGAKFRDYFDYSEPLKRVPPHRALALFRGRSEGVLRLALKFPEELENTGYSMELGPCERRLSHHFSLKDEGRAADGWFTEVVRLTWRGKLAPSIETNLLSTLRATAEEEAIRVFAQNLKDLLLAAPAGMHATMGLDPGIRTGVKVAVVAATGKLLDTATIYPFQPKNDVRGSIAKLSELAQRHQVSLIAIGNGTASRETDALVGKLVADQPKLGLRSVMVSEAGASVYSASEFAAREFPTLDVSIRGAVSIARRLQDPLAELVKIDPQSIGVGQYQHDVSQMLLAKSLDAVVEDCVNSVGVDVNTASAPLLARIAGLSSALADNVVAMRDIDGPFVSRKQLLKVPRLGPKAFEQAAGFLRIANGKDPLDASAVHPEAYPVVQKMLADVGKPISELMGNGSLLGTIKARDYVGEKFGLPTVQDILGELEKPGRDPRPEFKTAAFKAGVNEISDLAPDMMLEGVVTNVTNFGAFVDVGVHQDGLVHISMLADKFVKDPHEIVKAGDVVTVRVMEVDTKRKRIALSMRSGASDDARPIQARKSADGAANQARQPSSSKGAGRHRSQRGGDNGADRHGGTQKGRPDAAQGTMAAALADALKKNK
jgi:protein Tex